MKEQEENELMKDEAFHHKVVFCVVLGGAWEERRERECKGREGESRGERRGGREKKSTAPASSKDLCPSTDRFVSKNVNVVVLLNDWKQCINAVKILIVVV